MTVNTTHSLVKQLAKNLQIGVILYKLYYAPKGFLQQCFRKGPIDMLLNYQAQMQMEKAVYQLPAVETEVSAIPLEIYFLSGRKFWYQTCFCAYSMMLHGKTNLRPVIYDDGTLEKKYQQEIQRIFPNAKIVLQPEIEACMDEYLPRNKFPYLRERRLNYPNMRKLTDIHAGSQGWKLVLDSDMLFFRSPTFLLNWLKSPQQPCHMVDVETSYGYSEGLMTSLAQAKMPHRLNVGICGLKSEEIDWEQLEFWCKTTIEQEGTSYYQEQALTAMLVANQSCAVAPAEEYVVMPKCEEVIQPQAVLHHYVANSKPWYFRYGWKHVFQSEHQLLAMRCSA